MLGQHAAMVGDVHILIFLTLTILQPYFSGLLSAVPPSQEG